jgi:transcriptional regulator with XRE-family HTH domain
MSRQNVGQRELAELSGVGHSTVSRLLHGQREPTFAVLVALSRAMGADALDIG